MDHQGLDGEFDRWVRATDEYANHLSRHPSLDLKERQRLVELSNGLQGRFRHPDGLPADQDDAKRR